MDITKAAKLIAQRAIDNQTKIINERGGSYESMWPRAFGQFQGSIIGLLDRLQLTEEQLHILEGFSEDSFN